MAVDIFVAGQETTTTTLRWSMALLAAHADVQTRCREEIRAVLGDDAERVVSQADKAKLPYVTATIHEIQRIANIIPFNFFLTHKTTTDTQIADYEIPRDTVVNVDIHNIHLTDPLFVEPEKFNPSRYLAEDGVTLRKDLIERTIPFGYGKRVCAGEGLARLELLMGIVTTIQHFRITPHPDEPLDFNPIYGGVLFPQPHRLRLSAV